LIAHVGPPWAFRALRFYRTDNGWRVRTYVRDPDGKTREVERRGRTKNAAEQALKTALLDRSNHGGTTQEIKQTTKVRVLAESWFAEFAGNGNALNTIQLYRDRLDRQVIPSLGGLYVHELTLCDRPPCSRPYGPAASVILETQRGTFGAAFRGRASSGHRRTRSADDPWRHGWT
jgi:hypothetical protein